MAYPELLPASPHPAPRASGAPAELSYPRSTAQGSAPPPSPAATACWGYNLLYWLPLLLRVCSRVTQWPSHYLTHPKSLFREAVPPVLLRGISQVRGRLPPERPGTFFWSFHSGLMRWACWRISCGFSTTPGALCMMGGFSRLPHRVLCTLGHFLWLSQHTLCAVHDGTFSHGFPMVPCVLRMMMGCSTGFSHHSLCAVHAGTCFCYSSAIVSSASSANILAVSLSLCCLLLCLSGHVLSDSLWVFCFQTPPQYPWALGFFCFFDLFPLGQHFLAELERCNGQRAGIMHLGLCQGLIVPAGPHARISPPHTQRFPGCPTPAPSWLISHPLLQSWGPLLAGSSDRNLSSDCTAIHTQ